MTAPLVSVIIPCYNQGRFLGQAIDSALTQTHLPIEVIVVDDGSTDDSAEVAARYPGVRCVKQPNRGAAAARNAGLRESTGEYVIFLDSDDRLLPDAAAIGLQHFVRHPESAMVTGRVRLIAEDGSPAGTPAQPLVDGDRYVALLRSNYIWTPGAAMYRRSIFDEIGPFDSAAGGSADYELNIRVARRFPVGCHDEVVLEYRQHAANMSADVRYMLRSAVTVRRAQRRHVIDVSPARQAWEAGIRTVRADYGTRLIDQIKADLRVRGRRGRAIRGVLALTRYHPAGLVTIVRDSVRRLVKG
jgi:glycosyltransferase involved in cell wall biosynthesis